MISPDSGLFSKLVPLIFTLSFLIDCSACSGQSLSDSRLSSNPYCGVNSLYTVLRLHDRDVSFEELLETELVGDINGSSIQEIIDVANSFGLHTLPVMGLAPSELKHSPYPAILYVRSHIDVPTNDHFVLYLGELDGLARIYDAPKQPRLEPFERLGNRWDGTAVFFAESPISLKDFGKPKHLRKFLFGMPLLAVSIVLLTRRYWKHARFIGQP